MSIEILERAIARLEELKAGATHGEWWMVKHRPGSVFDVDYDIYAGDGGDCDPTILTGDNRANGDLIVALSRTVDPLIAMHRRSLLSMKAAIGAGMSEADVNEVAERSGEVELARAVLGEVSR